MSLRPEGVLHLDLENSVVFRADLGDGQSGDVAVVMTGEAVQVVSLEPPVACPGRQHQLLHLPLDLGLGLPAHLHLHVGVRPGRALEPRLGVQVELGRPRHCQMYRGGVGDLLLSPDEIVGVADVLPVVLEDDVLQAEDPGVAPDDDLVVQSLNPLVVRLWVGVSQAGEAHSVPNLTGDLPTGLQRHDVRRVCNISIYQTQEPQDRK